ncbi:tRNA (adenosine(37)-N6)-threonylcarbamoyltransferase complex dimerization subunit type 1 TsaB [Desulfocurvus sp. DL9XJH121]
MPASSAPVLALNGCEARIQALLAKDGEVLACRELAVAGSAMQHLAPAIQGLLADMGLAAADLGGVACVRGPGGFTGLRMILATALGLARAADLPLAGLDYLPLLAAGPAPLLSGPLAVLTHSRSSQVYAQAFACPAGGPLGPPLPLSLEQAAAWLKDAGAARALGSGLRKHAEFFAQAVPGLSPLPEDFDHPLPRVLARAAALADYSPDDIEPLYLRASDAEDNLSAIAAGRGLDPADARERLDRATSSLNDPNQDS